MKDLSLQGTALQRIVFDSTLFYEVTNMSTKLSAREAYRLLFNEFPGVVNVPQMCQMLGGISSKTAYQLLRENKVQHFRIGKGYKIPKLSIIAYLNVVKNPPFAISNLSK